MTPEKIAGLEALLEKANPGPWVLHDAEAFDGRSTTYYKEVWDENLNVIAEEVYRAHNDGGSANMHLIALAPTLARHVLTQQAQIERLEAAIKRQAGAAATLRQHTLSEVQELKDKDRSEYAAAKTLDGEREANAMLTEENERLSAQIAALAEDAARAHDLALENERLKALVDSAASIFTHCEVSDGVCCCGDNMDDHAHPMSCGHTPVDHGQYAVNKWCQQHAALDTHAAIASARDSIPEGE